MLSRMHCTAPKMKPEQANCVCVCVCVWDKAPPSKQHMPCEGQGLKCLHWLIVPQPHTSDVFRVPNCHFRHTG
jgi:hypothetical protein